MLNKLSIHNYALINQIDIDFKDGLSVITGETGAGKSIILGALSMILGGRADTKSIGNADKKSIIEATFYAKNDAEIDKFCTSNDIDRFEDNNFILRREISSSGRSRAFINDTPVTLQQLRDAAIRLIDIHSQHQNLLIADAKYQLQIIDSIANNVNELNEYKTQFKKYIEIRNRLNQRKIEISKNKENEEFLRFQFDQLQKIAPKENEQEELERKYEVLSNAESIKDDLRHVVNTLSDNEDSVLSQISALKSVINRLNLDLFNAESNDIKPRFESLYLELKDIAEQFGDCLSEVDSDPKELQSIEHRLNLIYEANRRFNVNNENELLKIKVDIESQLASIDNSDDDISALEQKKKSEGIKLKELADKLSQTRIKAADQFSSELIEMAKPLGMSNIKFSALVSQNKMTIDGQDSIEFLCSFNKNQSLNPISKVASGGEMSRIMLCIKAIIANCMQLPTIIFDEIDTGVSGDIADRMGEMMKEISDKIQVITITHLPQVASKGLIHYKVYKTDNEQYTTTNIKELSTEERIEELAQMLSGSKINEAAILNAQSLLNQQ
ncbi:MAG: DNA repair protein RecN [Muribaculaceae bacterium]|nr:DNA repair protein RecN [Muribaculaceae bacterium]